MDYFNHTPAPLEHALSMETKCDYLNAWIKKQSHTQKSHPKWWTPEIQLGNGEEEEGTHLPTHKLISTVTKSNLQLWKTLTFCLLCFSCLLFLPVILWCSFSLTVPQPIAERGCARDASTAAWTRVDVWRVGRTALTTRHICCHRHNGQELSWETCPPQQISDITYQFKKWLKNYKAPVSP